MTWLAVVTALRKAPTAVWWLVIGALVVGSAAWSVQAYGDRRDAEGFARATQNAHFDSVMVERVRRRVDTVAAQTDTIVRRVTVTRLRVDTLIQRVPDSLRVVPEIAQLLENVKQFTTQVDTLTRALDLEREARRMERVVNDAQLSALRSVVAVTQDSLRTVTEQRNARVSKLTAATLFVGGLVGGLVIGVIK